ncbi:hypothetical protein FRB99_007928 [Tulasnella sp. 403]|nr:hypothetical protein FRB99_007928 [Tulasnella sp. 403]
MNNDPSDLDYLDATFKALDSFQMSIAVLKSRINARRNLLLPIHQLPGELFIRILKYAMGFNDDGWHHDPSLSRFHRVAQVSVHWRDTILSSSSFWRTLRDDQDEHLRATVLRLNSSGPLVLRTRASNTAVADAFLERMLPLAPRWQIIAALRRYSDALFSHLQHIPPTLKDLCIIITDDNDTHHFPMTEGFPLRHVDLIRVSIPWDSSRLRNLHTLSLEHLDANQPTIGQIVSILSSSPHLWRLILRNWKHNPHLADDRRRYTDIVMVLPSLTTLFLELVPTAVVNFFIRHTKTTALACLAVETIEPLDAVDAIRPGSTLSDMLKQVLSHPSIKTTSITYDDALETMRIQSRHRPSRPTQLVYWAVVPPGLAITISTRVGALCSSMWQVLADVLDANAPCTSLNFVNRGQAPPLSESDDACLPRRFPVAVLSHLPHLDSITFDKEFNAGPVLKYLGVPKHDENGGVLWLCPRSKPPNGVTGGSLLFERSGWKARTSVSDVELEVRSCPHRHHPMQSTLTPVLPASQKRHDGSSVKLLPAVEVAVAGVQIPPFNTTLASLKSMATEAASRSMRAAVTVAVEVLFTTMNEVDRSDPSSMEYFDSSLKALYAFQQSIATTVAHVARRRNLLLPIHRLPEETVVQTLQLATEFNDDGWHHKLSQIHDMAQVSVHWRKIILSTPSFWRVAGDYQDERLQASVLRLNLDGPLVLWSKMSPRSIGDAFLARMIPLAHRWRSVIVHRSFSDALSNHLQHIPPTLKDLCLVITGENETHPFPLPEGKPLRHIDLARISIPWNSSRLRNLQTILLEHLYSNQPTLGQIVSILVSSPNLWRLVFRKWDCDEPPDYTEDVNCYADTVIALPSLSTLVVDLIPAPVVTFLINHIQTTTLSCLIADPIKPVNAVDVVHPDSPLFGMLKQALQLPSIENTSAVYDDELGKMRIQSEPKPNRSIELVYWVDDSPGIDVTVLINVGALCGPTWEILTDILANNAPCLSFDFVDNNPNLPELEEGEEPVDIWAPHRFPLALLPHLPRITSMDFTLKFNATPLLRHLGVSKCDLDEEPVWVCPRLTTVTIRTLYNDDIDIIVADVMVFIWRRYLERAKEDEEGQEGSDGPDDDAAAELSDDEEDDEADLTEDEEDADADEGNATGEGTNRDAREQAGSGADEESKSDMSSSAIGRYPVMLTQLKLPAEVVSKLREAEDVAYLDRRGVLIDANEE